MKLFLTLLISCTSIDIFVSTSKDDISSFDLIDDHTTQWLSNYNTLAIFSKCINASNHTEVNKEAMQLWNTQNWDYTATQLYRTNHVRYQDICNDTKKLLEIMVNLLLNKTYFFEPDQKSNGKLIWQHQNIGYIQAVVPQEMAQLIKEFFSFTDVFKICSPRSCDDRFQLNSIDDRVRQLQFILDRYHWYDVLLIFVSSDNSENEYWESYYNSTTVLLKNTKMFCIKTKRIDDSKNIHFWQTEDQIRKFLTKVASKSTAVIFYGSRFLMEYLFDAIEGFLLNNYRYNPIIVPHLNPKWYEVTEAKRRLPWLTLYQRARGTSGLISDATNVWKENMLNYRPFNDEIKSLQLSNKESRHQIGLFYVVPYFHDKPKNIEFEEDRDIIYANVSKKLLQNSEMFIHLKAKPCQRVNCPPGYEQTYGVIDDDDSYDKKYGFKCQQCLPNHVKSFYGDGKCRKCVIDPFLIDNGKRTMCIDPYTNVDMKFTDLQYHLILSSGSLCILMTFVMLIVFIIKHDTPIVRSSDKILSISHFVNIILCVSALLYINLFHMETTTPKCIAMNLILSILYVINVAFIYTKSQKLLMAFRASIHLTRKEVRLTSAVQVFIVAICLIIANAISIVIFNQAPIDVSFFLDKEHMLRIHYCNTEYHENVLIVFITILQMMCLIQAYKGRHLPGPMNNSMSLVYAVLMINVSFLSSFPIIAFLDQVDKRFARITVLIINFVIIIMLLYAKKCYTIVFKPQKNTRAYFTRKRQEVSMKNHRH